jgi:hypothetical protein
MSEHPADHLFLAGRHIQLRGSQQRMTEHELDVRYLQPPPGCL